MKELIEALQIMLKYGDVPFPTHCEHDELRVYPAVSPSEFSPEDLARLDELSFTPDSEEGFISFRYGSC